MGLSYKAAATLITGERLLSSHSAILVNSLMSEEVRTAGESFPAFGTVVWPLCRVNNFLVPHQSLTVGETLVTPVTWERGLSGVPASVDY